MNFRQLNKLLVQNNYKYIPGLSGHNSQVAPLSGEPKGKLNKLSVALKESRSKRAGSRASNRVTCACSSRIKRRAHRQSSGQFSSVARYYSTSSPAQHKRLSLRLKKDWKTMKNSRGNTRDATQGRSEKLLPNKEGVTNRKKWTKLSMNKKQRIDKLLQLNPNTSKKSISKIIQKNLSLSAFLRKCPNLMDKHISKRTYVTNSKDKKQHIKDDGTITFCPEPPCDQEKFRLPYYYRRVPIDETNGSKIYEMRRTYFNFPDKTNNANIPYATNALTAIDASLPDDTTLNTSHFMSHNSDKIQTKRKYKRNRCPSATLLNELLTKLSQHISETDSLPISTNSQSTNLLSEKTGELFSPEILDNIEKLTDVECQKTLLKLDNFYNIKQKTSSDTINDYTHEVPDEYVYTGVLNLDLKVNDHLKAETPRYENLLEGKDFSSILASKLRKPHQTNENFNNIQTSIDDATYHNTNLDKLAEKINKNTNKEQKEHIAIESTSKDQILMHDTEYFIAKWKCEAKRFNRQARTIDEDCTSKAVQARNRVHKVANIIREENYRIARDKKMQAELNNRKTLDEKFGELVDNENSDLKASTVNNEIPFSKVHNNATTKMTFEEIYAKNSEYHEKPVLKHTVLQNDKQFDEIYQQQIKDSIKDKSAHACAPTLDKFKKHLEAKHDEVCSPPITWTKLLSFEAGEYKSNKELKEKITGYISNPNKLPLPEKPTINTVQKQDAYLSENVSNYIGKKYTKLEASKNSNLHLKTTKGIQKQNSNLSLKERARKRIKKKFANLHKKATKTSTKHKKNGLTDSHQIVNYQSLLNRLKILKNKKCTTGCSVYTNENSISETEKEKNLLENIGMMNLSDNDMDNIQNLDGYRDLNYLATSVNSLIELEKMENEVLKAADGPYMDNLHLYIRALWKAQEEYHRKISDVSSKIKKHSNKNAVEAHEKYTQILKKYEKRVKAKEKQALGTLKIILPNTANKLLKERHSQIQEQYLSQANCKKNKSESSYDHKTSHTSQFTYPNNEVENDESQTTSANLSESTYNKQTVDTLDKTLPNKNLDEKVVSAVSTSSTSRSTELYLKQQNKNMKAIYSKLDKFEEKAPQVLTNKIVLTNKTTVHNPSAHHLYLAKEKKSKYFITNKDKMHKDLKDAVKINLISDATRMSLKQFVTCSHSEIQDEPVYKTNDCNDSHEENNTKMAENTQLNIRAVNIAMDTDDGNDEEFDEVTKKQLVIETISIVSEPVAIIRDTNEEKNDEILPAVQTNEINDDTTFEIKNDIAENVAFNIINSSINQLDTTNADNVVETINAAETTNAAAAAASDVISTENENTVMRKDPSQLIQDTNLKEIMLEEKALANPLQLDDYRRQESFNPEKISNFSNIHFTDPGLGAPRQKKSLGTITLTAIQPETPPPPQPPTAPQVEEIPSKNEDPNTDNETSFTLMTIIDTESGSNDKSFEPPSDYIKEAVVAADLDQPNDNIKEAVDQLNENIKELVETVNLVQDCFNIREEINAANLEQLNEKISESVAAASVDTPSDNITVSVIVENTDQTNEEVQNPIGTSNLDAAGDNITVSVIVENTDQTNEEVQNPIGTSNLDAASENVTDIEAASNMTTTVHYDSAAAKFTEKNEKEDKAVGDASYLTEANSRSLSTVAAKINQQKNYYRSPRNLKSQLQTDKEAVCSSPSTVKKINSKTSSFLFGNGKQHYSTMTTNEKCTTTTKNITTNDKLKRDKLDLHTAKPIDIKPVATARNRKSSESSEKSSTFRRTPSEFKSFKSVEKKEVSAATEKKSTGISSTTKILNPHLHSDDKRKSESSCGASYSSSSKKKTMSTNDLCNLKSKSSSEPSAFIRNMYYGGRTRIPGPSINTKLVLEKEAIDTCIPLKTYNSLSHLTKTEKFTTRKDQPNEKHKEKLNLEKKVACNFGMNNDEIGSPCTMPEKKEKCKSDKKKTKIKNIFAHTPVEPRTEHTTCPPPKYKSIKRGIKRSIPKEQNKIPAKSLDIQRQPWYNFILQGIKNVLAVKPIPVQNKKLLCTEKEVDQRLEMKNEKRKTKTKLEKAAKLKSSKNTKIECPSQHAKILNNDMYKISPRLIISAKSSPSKTFTTSNYLGNSSKDLKETKSTTTKSSKIDIGPACNSKKENCKEKKQVGPVCNSKKKKDSSERKEIGPVCKKEKSKKSDSCEKKTNMNCSDMEEGGDVSHLMKQKKDKVQKLISSVSCHKYSLKTNAREFSSKNARGTDQSKTPDKEEKYRCNCLSCERKNISPSYLSIQMSETELEKDDSRKILFTEQIKPNKHTNDLKTATISPEAKAKLFEEIEEKKQQAAEAFKCLPRLEKKLKYSVPTYLLIRDQLRDMCKDDDEDE